MMNTPSMSPRPRKGENVAKGGYAPGPNGQPIKPVPVPNDSRMKIPGPGAGPSAGRKKTAPRSPRSPRPTAPRPPKGPANDLARRKAAGPSAPKPYQQPQVNNNPGSGSMTPARKKPAAGTAPYRQPRIV